MTVYVFFVALIYCISVTIGSMVVFNWFDLRGKWIDIGPDENGDHRSFYIKN